MDSPMDLTDEACVKVLLREFLRPARCPKNGPIQQAGQKSAGHIARAAAAAHALDRRVAALPAEWERRRRPLMLSLLRDKFRRDATLRERLLMATSLTCKALAEAREEGVKLAEALKAVESEAERLKVRHLPSSLLSPPLLRYL